MRTILVLALIATLTSCDTQGDATPSPSADGFDPQGSWQLAEGRAGGAEVPIVADHPITLTIEGSQIGGTAACNSYGGRLTATGGRLDITELAMTAMGCEEPAMAAEAAYVAALDRVDAIGPDGAQLVLRGPEVELRFERLPDPPTAELVDTVWILETVFIGDVASSPVGQRATLELRADGTFAGSTGCRTFSGRWQEQGEQIVAPIFAMGEEECPADLRQQDDHVVSVIGDGFVPTIERGLLTLTDPGGVGLVYRSE